MNERFLNLQQWLKHTLHLSDLQLQPLAGDASFRRYYRLQLSPQQTYMIMDAPPGVEDVKPFMAIAETFSALGVCVPQILAADVEQGFLVLSDFGDRLYLTELTAQNADQLYQTALHALIKIQRYQDRQPLSLPVFDAAFMMRELTFFEEWFLAKHVKETIPAKLLQQVYRLLIESAEQQPQLCVHRDYHSRNLMVLPDKQVGILDFQDAVWGPAVYDAVSLLRDCYIAWPRAQVEQWVMDFYQYSCEAGILKNAAPEQYLRWFDLMGVQRHLKAIFIFARKFHRDGSTHYLADIPRTLEYVLDVSSRYSELRDFHAVLVDKIAPKIMQEAAVA